MQLARQGREGCVYSEAVEVAITNCARKERVTKKTRSTSGKISEQRTKNVHDGGYVPESSAYERDSGRETTERGNERPDASGDVLERP